MSTSDLAALPKVCATGLNDIKTMNSDYTKMTPIDWLKDIQFYLVGLCYLSSRLIYMVVIAYMIYYVEFTLLLEKIFNAIVPLVLFISGFVMSWALEVAKKSISMNGIFVGSCILGLGWKLSVMILISCYGIYTSILNDILFHFS